MDQDRVYIVPLAQKLKRMVQWQQTPVPLTDLDYRQMIVDALQDLFVLTGRALEYTFDDYSDGMEGLAYEAPFPVDERRFLMLTAQIAFFNKVKTTVDQIVGYTTDALSVTNADKPYANLKNTIDDLKRQRDVIYYKMTRYTFL